MNRGLESIGDVLKRSFKQWQVYRPQNSVSFMPTMMTRLSPFFPISKRDMKNDVIEDPIIIENPWGRMTLTGRRLSIYDETVLFTILILLKKSGSGTIKTTLHELCGIMGVKPARDTYNAILKSLERMSEAYIKIERRLKRQVEIDGPIITGIDHTKGIDLKMNPYFVQALNNRFITHIDMGLRSNIKGDVSKALYRFLEGQRSDCYAISILKLSQAINIDSNGKAFRQRIRKSMHDLEKVGYLRRFILPDRGQVVAIFKSKYRYLNN